MCQGAETTVLQEVTEFSQEIVLVRPQLVIFILCFCMNQLNEIQHVH